MHERSEADELLQESEPISDEERSRILSEIDDEFRSILVDKDSSESLSAKSSGLLFPVTIGIAALVVSVLVIFIFTTTFSRDSNTILEADGPGGFSSQWEILNLYIEESSGLLAEKDTEIADYQERIRSYDERIATLRELIRIKDEVEKRLFSERRKMSNDGLTEAQIDKQLSTIERGIFSNLAPEILDSYHMSIDEINAQINQILNDKQYDMERLEKSIKEREILVKETHAIEKEIQTLESESFVSKELIDTIDELNTVIAGYQQIESDRSAIRAGYSEIMKYIDAKKYSAAQAQVDELESAINEAKKNPDLADMYDFGVDDRVARMFREYINTILASRRTAKAPSEAPDRPETLAVEIPAPVTQITAETDLPTKPNLVLIGTITSTGFNRIDIMTVDAPEVAVGNLFYVYRLEESGESMRIGSGVITQIGDNSITGRLESLVNLSSKPQINDEVYLLNTE